MIFFPLFFLIDFCFSSTVKESDVTLLADFNSKYESNMINYINENKYRIPLEKGQREEYIEEIKVINKTIKGYYILSDILDLVEFKIVSPQNVILFHSINHYDFFKIKLSGLGNYKVVVANSFSNNSVEVLVSFDSGQNQVLVKGDIQKKENQLRSLFKVIDRFNNDFTVRRNKRQENYKSN